MAHTPPPAVAAPVGTDEELKWLLNRFVDRVPGVTGVVLISRDGLRKAQAGVGVDQADKIAALAGGMHALARNVAEVSGSAAGGFRQVIVEDDGVLVFVISTRHAAAHQPDVDPGQVSSVLCVLADPGADPGAIGYEMSSLVGSMGDHLATATRTAQPQHTDQTGSNELAGPSALAGAAEGRQ